LAAIKPSSSPTALIFIDETGISTNMARGCAAGLRAVNACRHAHFAPYVDTMWSPGCLIASAAQRHPQVRVDVRRPLLAAHSPTAAIGVDLCEVAILGSQHIIDDAPDRFKC
jgi:hypothetical protein